MNIAFEDLLIFFITYNVFVRISALDTYLIFRCLGWAVFQAGACYIFTIFIRTFSVSLFPIKNNNEERKKRKHTTKLNLNIILEVSTSSLSTIPNHKVYSPR